MRSWITEHDENEVTSRCVPGTHVIDRLLYHTPGSCSRVALTALEEIGDPYRETCVSLMTGAQRAPDFLAINPKGKVPVLVEDGVAITELPVILYHLAVASPASRLLPMDEPKGSIDLSSLADLVWVAGTLHTTVARCFRPSLFSTLDPDGVKKLGIAQLAVHATMISQRLSSRRWWYGESWSIVDSFLAWIFALAAQSEFDLHDFPVLEKHRVAAELRPSFVRARATEQKVAVREQLAMPPGFSL